MRLIHFLRETQEDVESVLDALKNAPTPDNRTEHERDQDEHDNRIFKNPLPSLSIDDPRFGEWYGRGDEILFLYAQDKGWSIRDKGMLRAGEVLGQKQIVPIDQLIGTERYLDPRGLKRKPTDKFSSKIPVIYKVDGNMLVVDGNHRIVQAHQEGQKEIFVLVIDVDALEQEIER